jgi:formylglycine-generating enzyme required for sulfatase activity
LRQSKPELSETGDTIAEKKSEIPPDWMPELISLKGGTFMMGDADEPAATPVHQVTIGDCMLGRYEVTVAQFKKFVDEEKYITTAEQKGSSLIYVQGQWKNEKGINWRYDAQGNPINTSDKNRPVVHVSWQDANAYCKWLSKKTGFTYRLPTEAEWEFAARDGDSSNHFTFSGSDTINRVGWYKENSGDLIHAVGQKQSNALGIYDMTGNALEWCNDWYDDYQNSPQVNPMGPDTPRKDSAKVLRGGAWAYKKEVATNVYRSIRLKTEVSGGSTGFRVCKVNK